jgi:hypothetical protein
VPLKAMSITYFVYPQMDKKNVVAMDGQCNSLSFPRPTWKAQNSTFVLCFLSVSFFIFNARRKQTPSLYFFVCHKKKVNSITKFTQNSQGFQSQKGLSFPKSSFSIFFFFFFSFSSLFLCLYKEKTNTFTKTKLVKSHELIINILITTYKRSDLAFR